MTAPDILREFEVSGEKGVEVKIPVHLRSLTAARKKLQLWHIKVVQFQNRIFLINMDKQESN